MPILMVARAMPMVRATNPMRCYWSANTCSTWARILDRRVLALAIRSGSDRLGLRLWWIWRVHQEFRVWAGG